MNAPEEVGRVNALNDGVAVNPDRELDRAWNLADAGTKESLDKAFVKANVLQAEYLKRIAEALEQMSRLGVPT